MIDATCLHCGRCCFKKFKLRGTMVNTSMPCQFLDRDTRLCTVYEKRHKVNPECLTVEEGIKVSAFPADCPYVRGLAGYVPPEEMGDDDGTLVGFVIRLGRLLLRARRRA